MADDKPVVKQQGEIETPDSGATTEEPKTTSPVETKVGETQETKPTEELTEEEVSSLSERAQKRFRELSQKAKRADELEAQVKGTPEGEHDKFLDALAPRQEAISPTNAPPVSPLPWETQEVPTEVTMEDYKRDVTATADAIAQARAADVEFRLRKENEIRGDEAKIARQWPELNPESSEYRPDLSNKLATIFKKQLYADKSARLYDLVKTVMEVRSSGVEKGKTEVTAKLVKQKAEEAVTPSAETGLPEEKPEDIFKDPHRVKEQEAYLKKQGLWE